VLNGFIPRFFWGTMALRVYLALLLLLILFSAGIRIRSFLLTRKIYAVLSGLEQVHVDTTTEEQLLRTVPYLMSVGEERRSQAGVQRHYLVRISDDEDLRWMWWVPAFLLSLSPPRTEIPVRDKWDSMNLPLKAAYLLGWRNLSFSASATVLNGTVSSTSYNIEPDVLFGFPVSYLVVARSAHGFFGRHSVPVQSTDDESPDFRFGTVAGQFSWQEGADNSIAVAYTPDAGELVSHVFRVDLSCYWGIRGCDSVRHVTPLLWKDRQAIVDATAVRLASADPCPARILEGRVRTLPDLNVALLEVVRSRDEELNYEGDRSAQIATDYRLREAIRGQPQGPWTDFLYRYTVPWSLPSRRERLNPIRPSYAKAGEKFLYFSGATFDSCRIVAATPSAESAVRTAKPPPKRSEDDLATWMGPRR
jgi:hypothetical protein